MILTLPYSVMNDNHHHQKIQIIIADLKPILTAFSSPNVSFTDNKLCFLEIGEHGVRRDT